MNRDIMFDETFYYKYEKNGGNVEMPKEIFWDLYYSSKEEIERLNNKEEQLTRRLEDLIIVGEQVENEWAVDICKMIIKELKGEK